MTARRPLLFQRYPAAEPALPWRPLVQAPTPVGQLRVLGERIGAQSIWAKRDDLTSTVVGGTAVRKLEWVLAAVQQQGAARILTVGPVGSAHVLAAAVHGRDLGLGVDAILFPARQPDAQARRLCRAALAQGVRPYWAPARLVLPLVAAAHRLRLRLASEQEGLTCYVPASASLPSGCLGLVEAALELRGQIERGELPEPQAIYVPAGSGATLAGLVLGCRVAGLAAKVVGVRVTDRQLCGRRRIAHLANGALALMRKAGIGLDVRPVRPGDITLLDGHAGAGCGAVTRAAAEAVALAEELERIHLEPACTGKALSGLLREVVRWRALRMAPVLLWCTGPSTSLGALLDGGDEAAVQRCPLGLRRLLSQHD